MTCVWCQKVLGGEGEHWDSLEDGIPHRLRDRLRSLYPEAREDHAGGGGMCTGCVTALKKGLVLGVSYGKELMAITFAKKGMIDPVTDLGLGDL